MTQHQHIDNTVSRLFSLLGICSVIGCPLRIICIVVEL